MTAFHSDGSKPIKCGKMGYRAKDWHSRETKTCFICGQKGHLASSGRNGQQKSSTGGCGSDQSSNHSSASGLSGEHWASPWLWVQRLHDKEQIRRRGTGRCFVRTIRAVLVYWNWGTPSGCHPTQGIWCRSSDWRTRGAMIQFKDNPTINTHNGTVVPMMTNDELFSVMAQPVETGSLAMMSHSVKHWQRLMAHNNWHDVAKLQQDVVGMNISGSEKKTNCNICCTEKAKRASIPKTWGTRAKTKLAIVHTDVLGPARPSRHDAMHDDNCRGPKAVLAFCSFNCHLPEESINPLGAWQDPFRDVSRKHQGCFTEPDLSHLHVFWCQSFVLNEVRKKLDSKAREATLLGYSRNSKAYVVTSTDGSETRAPKVRVSRNLNFNDDAFPYQRGSAATQEESEDDDASQSDVDDLKSGLDEQFEATSTKTHAIQGESEDNINPDEGTRNVTDSTLAVQQTTTRCSGRTRRVPQQFGDYVTGRELENLALHCDALISSGLPSIQ